jgi:hypothetical protein
MWDPRRLTTLWASTACYRDSFTYCYVGMYFTCLSWAVVLKRSQQNRFTDICEVLLFVTAVAEVFAPPSLSLQISRTCLELLELPEMGVKWAGLSVLHRIPARPCHPWWVNSIRAKLRSILMSLTKLASAGLCWGHAATAEMCGL